jgi:chromosomal replication initiator protein
MNDLWRRCLARLEAEFSAEDVHTYLAPLQARESEAGLTLWAPNAYTLEIVRDSYLPEVRRVLEHLAGHAVAVNLQVGAASNGAEPSGARAPRSAKAAERRGPEPNLDPHYTFESFVEGTSNQLGKAAAMQVAQNPGRAYNPLLLYGGTGLGKTHLMHAIGHFVRAQRPHAKVFFVSAEKFMNEMIYAIQHATTLEFKARYRSADLLLIDDIQFLEGKESTQEEFFHTFNALHDQHRQIVLTSDGPPNSMTALEERLLSRFTWGVVADIQPPDLETRVAIVKKKAVLQNRMVPNEIALLLASNIKNNIRDLEGSLARLLAFAELTNSKLTVEFAQDVLRDQIKPDLVRFDVHDIQRIVSRHFNVTEESLRGKRRTDTIAFPRQIGMYIARTLTDLSLAEIGAKFGGRDHTTVLHACQKIEALISNDPEMRGVVEELMAQLTA